MTDKSFVTLEQHVCKVCNKPFDTGAILLDRRLHERFEHHTVTGHGLCPEDQAKFDEGYVALVALDPTKSNIGATDKIVKPEDAYRTGAIAHVRRGVYEQIFNVALPADLPMAFCDPEVISILEKMQKGGSDGNTNQE